MREVAGSGRKLRRRYSSDPAAELHPDRHPARAPGPSHRPGRRNRLSAGRQWALRVVDRMYRRPPLQLLPSRRPRPSWPRLSSGWSAILATRSPGSRSISTDAPTPARSTGPAISACRERPARPQRRAAGSLRHYPARRARPDAAIGKPLLRRVPSAHGGGLRQPACWLAICSAASPRNPLRAFACGRRTRS